MATNGSRAFEPSNPISFKGSLPPPPGPIGLALARPAAAMRSFLLPLSVLSFAVGACDNPARPWRGWNHTVTYTITSTVFRTRTSTISFANEPSPVPYQVLVTDRADDHSQEQYVSVRSNPLFASITPDRSSAWLGCLWGGDLAFTACCEDTPDLVWYSGWKYSTSALEWTSLPEKLTRVADGLDVVTCNSCASRADHERLEMFMNGSSVEIRSDTFRNWVVCRVGLAEILCADLRGDAATGTIAHCRRVELSLAA